MLQRLVDAAAVEAEIERVRSLSGAALRRRWQAEFGRPLPKSLPGDLLRRMIAKSRSGPTALSGRESPIPACRRSRGPLPARFGTASRPQATIRPCTAAAMHGLPPKRNHPHRDQHLAPVTRANPPRRSIIMSPRPYWKGYLKLALVSCPIALHAVCSSAERISFRQINRKTGNRLRQQAH
jgi:hypothetical protein